MYVIATVICPNFHFSVSPHVPFLNLLFEQIANSNEYLLAKFGFDTAENEPCQASSKSIHLNSGSPRLARCLLRGGRRGRGLGRAAGHVRDLGAVETSAWSTHEWRRWIKSDHICLALSDKFDRI